MPRVSIGFVDGSGDAYEESAAFMRKLKELQSQGLEGRALIEALITDDWGPPPKHVTIVDGDFELTIPYD